MMRFVIFGVLGMAGQVAATAVMGMVASRRIDCTGHASLILFPFWGLIAFLYPLVAVQVGGIPWYARGGIYLGLFYVLQLLVGMLLTKLRLCPWSYGGKAQLAGLIRLADAPAFFVAGLAIEWIYPYAKAAADAIA